MKRFSTLLGALVLTLTVSGCDDLLTVEDPVNLTPDDLAGAAPVDLTINGVRGSFQSMFDFYVLYTGMLADEFVLAGTFPYRGEFDERAIDPNNAGLLNDVYTPLSVSRFMADTAVIILESATGEGVADEARVQEGIALSVYFGGLTRALLAESFCSSALAGGPAVSPDERMRDALATFAEAEVRAQAAAQPELVAAARVGQARAHLWLREFSKADSIAAMVPPDFEFNSYYSNASTPQKNRVARFTWAIDEVIRWTVGDGTLEYTGYEVWPYAQEWIDLGLLEARPDLTSFNPSVPVLLQQKMPDGDAEIVIASGAEAQLIQAESLIRLGRPGEAALIVNGLRANWELGPITFVGDLGQDLPVMARERSRELWLTGERLPTLRRYLEDGVDLFPGGKLGSDTCLPIPQQELDTNPNL